MKGAEVQNELLKSNAQGAKITSIISVVGSFTMMRTGTKKGMFCVQVVISVLSQPYCACLSPSMMRIAVKREEVVMTVMSVTMINAAVVVGRMPLAVTTTACTV